MPPVTLFRRTLVLVLLPALAFAAGSSSMTGTQWVVALEHGGYVILMRHANSPETLPGPAQAAPGNTGHERQLDAEGRDSARAMGDAFRRLRIPVGEVLSSPTYRALETARLARFPAPRAFDELGDAGKSMSPVAGGSRIDWLRSRVAQPPKPGMNTIIITHYPNITGAFANDARNLAAGEALIFKPDAQGGAALIARVKIGDWAALASP